jgi:ribosomal protein S27AE
VLECWIDAASRLPLTTEVVARLQRAPRAARPSIRRAVIETAAAAIDEAHRILDTAADRRRDALSEQASDAHRRERAHARAYYDDTLRSLERRREGAEPDRAELLAARAASTREERARRLAEIDEKYQARHEIRPFRLHVVAVPGWRVPLDVRRGPRRYRVDRDWLPVLGAYADEPCPRCGEPAPLSASKTRLGCIRCQPGAELHAVSASA